MDDGDGTVCLVDAAEQRQRNGMISPERDDTGQGLAVDGNPGLISIGVGFPHQKSVVSVLNLTNGPRIVVAAISKH